METFVRGIHRGPTQRPMTLSFDVFFDQCLNKWLSKQWWGWWFATTLSPLWRHCNELLFLGMLQKNCCDRIASNGNTAELDFSPNFSWNSKFVTVTNSRTLFINMFAAVWNSMRSFKSYWCSTGITAAMLWGYLWEINIMHNRRKCLLVLIARGYPAKRALSAMRKHGG